MERIVRASAYEGAANMCSDGIARADPMIVCGRVNLHKTDKRDEKDLLPLAAALLIPLFDEGDIDSESRKTWSL